MHQRTSTDAEFIASISDWLVSSQRMSAPTVAVMSWADILILVEREFPGGLGEAMNHYSPRLAA
jgi:hypothetical protein